jgi:GT2 family glycosyltransferase
MARVAVVILNYNGKKYLEQFLPSVIENSAGAEVIVADNCSIDDSLAYLKEHHPGVQLILLETNHGYAGGYNKAIEQIGHEYCVLLNSDIEVTVGWLSPMIDFMQENTNVAACQPKILAYHEKTHFEYAGAAGGYIDTLGYPYCRGRMFDTLELDNGQYDDEKRIFWATGACLFVRRNNFIIAGGFDVHFFAHMEEIDLCWRFHHMGKSVFCIPKSVVYHVGGGTLNKINPQKTYLNFRNNLSLLFKNESSWSLLWKLPVKFALDWLAGLKFWKENSFAHFSAVIKAQRDFLLLLPINLKKRKETNLLKKGKSVACGKLFLPYQYFIKGRKIYSELPNN